MKTAIQIIDDVFTVLKTATNTPIVKLHTPDEWEIDQYYVINSLTLTPGTIDRVPVNINCHSKDKSKGIPNVSVLNSLVNTAKNAMTDFSNGTLITTLQSEVLLRDDVRDEHYVSLRFNVISIS